MKTYTCDEFQSLVNSFAETYQKHKQYGFEYPNGFGSSCIMGYVGSQFGMLQVAYVANNSEYYPCFKDTLQCCMDTLAFCIKSGWYTSPSNKEEWEIRNKIIYDNTIDPEFTL